MVLFQNISFLNALRRHICFDCKCIPFFSGFAMLGHVLLGVRERQHRPWYRTFDKQDWEVYLVCSFVLKKLSHWIYLVRSMLRPVIWNEWNCREFWRLLLVLGCLFLLVSFSIRVQELLRVSFWPVYLLPIFLSVLHRLVIAHRYKLLLEKVRIEHVHICNTLDFDRLQQEGHTSGGTVMSLLTWLCHAFLPAATSEG